MSDLLGLVRDSGGSFGMAVGLGNKDGTESDKIINVQIAATGSTAAILVSICEWLEANEWPDDVISDLEWCAMDEPERRSVMFERDHDLGTAKVSLLAPQQGINPDVNGPGAGSSTGGRA